MVTRSLISADAFESLAEQLGPCELVRGEVVRLSPADFRRARTCAIVSFLVAQWAEQKNCGRVACGGIGVRVESDPDTVRGADVAYISLERLPLGEEPSGFLVTPPELVVEVVGKGKTWKDLNGKVGEYLRMGVDRVWIIDPKTRRMHAFRPDIEPTALSEGDTIADADILPGFSCDVGELFSD